MENIKKALEHLEAKRGGIRWAEGVSRGYQGALEYVANIRAAAEACWYIQDMADWTKRFALKEKTKAIVGHDRILFGKEP
nr:MAG: hypothetical protein [Bacteriophage sp.]